MRSAGGRRLAVDKVLQLLAGLEVRNTFGRHVHARAGLGVASYARLPLPCPKAAESADFDLVPAAQRAHDTIKNGLDNHFRILARHFDYARDFFNQFSLGHVYRPSPFPRLFMASS